MPKPPVHRDGEGRVLVACHPRHALGDGVEPLEVQREPLELAALCQREELRGALADRPRGAKVRDFVGHQSARPFTSASFSPESAPSGV